MLAFAAILLLFAVVLLLFAAVLLLLIADDCLLVIASSVLQVASFVQRHRGHLRKEFAIKTVGHLVRYAKDNNFLKMMEDPQVNRNKTGVILLLEGKLLNKLNEFENIYDNRHASEGRDGFQSPQEFLSLLSTLSDAKSASEDHRRVVVCIRECVEAAKAGGPDLYCAYWICEAASDISIVFYAYRSFGSPFQDVLGSCRLEVIRGWVSCNPKLCFPAPPGLCQARWLMELI